FIKPAAMRVVFDSLVFLITRFGSVLHLRFLKSFRNYSGSQKSEFRSQNGNSGDVDELRRLLEEVSKLPAAYSRAIVNSDS
ncbi:MAG: hypothetical protein NTY64_22650, partial [Deltaproteobacteria bacterium]|nr:hypothetical protein [Deltaproteobacteria bacterium]